MTDHRDVTLAFKINDAAWKLAAAQRNDPEADPLFMAELYGFLEVVFGSVVIVRDDYGSIPSFACQLAQARQSGFPGPEAPTCNIDDSEGGWSLQLSLDQANERITALEFHRGRTGDAPAADAVVAIDLFLSAFTDELSARIPKALLWGQLTVLRPYAVGRGRP